MDARQNRTTGEMGAGKGAVALVTGAGSGIGRATAMMLAREGYRVALVGRDLAKLEAVAAEIHATFAGGVSSKQPVAVPLAADLASPQACEFVIAKAVGVFGRLDALVNNAGWSPLAPIARIKPEQVRAIFEINALAPVYLTRAAWGVFARQNAADGAARACIVNVSSKSSVDPFRGLGVYGAAKAAVNTLTRATANEGASIGLRALCVAPGAVETPLLRSMFPVAALPAERCLRPEDVARVILDCVLGGYDARNGETIFVESP